MLPPSLRVLPLLAALAACSSLVPQDAARAPGPAPAPARAGGPGLYVGFYDDDDEVLLELANEEHPELGDVNEASTTLRRATLKLAPRPVMEQLVAELEAIGFDEHARRGLAPQHEPLRGWVTVQRGDDVRTAVFPPGSLPRERWEAFVNLKVAVASYYQRTGGLRLIENPAGHELFGDGR